MKLKTLAFLGMYSVLSSVSANEQDSSSDEDVTELSTISVSGSKNNGPEISTDKLLKVPGSGGDPLKAIEALPGVVLGGFGPFNIPAIRGSSPRDNIYITDFVPVGFVFHNDGNSTYNPLLVENFSLNAAAWDAQYNNAMGAVLSTKLRDPYNEPIHTTLDVSFLRVGAMVEGAISEDSSFYASYRQSLLEFYVENFIDEDELTFTEVPKNNDYQLKYLWQPDSVSNLRVFATGANDSVGIEFGPESDDLAREPGLAGGLAAETYFHTQAIMYDTLLSGGTSTIVSLSRKEEDVAFGVGSLIDLDTINYDHRLKNFYNTPLDNGDSLRYGIELSNVAIDYTASGKDTPCNDDFETCSVASLGDDFQTSDVLEINSAYVFSAYDWLINPDWEFTLGLGASHNDFTEENVVQPRLKSKYALTQDINLIAAYGLHTQFPREFRYLDPVLGNPDLEMPYSNHYVLGLEQTFDDGLSSKVELYYKDIQNLIVSNTDQSANAAPYLNAAEGTAYGLELLINKNLTDQWYGWLSVAYSKTERTDTLRDIKIDYEYDRPWVVNLVASYKKSDRTTYGFKWRYQSGGLFTPVISAEPIDLNGNVVAAQDADLYRPTYADKNSERLPAYHRLDFRMDYKMSTRSDFYFEVINLYNQSNVSDYSYNRDYTEREEVTDLPTIFSVGAQLVF